MSQRVVAPGEPTDRNRPIKPDHTTSDGFVDVGQILQTPRRRNQHPSRLRSQIHPTRRPLLQRPKPITQRNLAPVQLPQQRHLCGSGTGDDRLMVEQLFLDRCGSETMMSHTRNLPPGCDRNRYWERRISKIPTDSSAGTRRPRQTPSATCPQGSRHLPRKERNLLGYSVSLRRRLAVRTAASAASRPLLCSSGALLA